VVDDEELLASAVSEILAHAGHSVTTFTQPAEAIRYLQSNPDVDALITDLAMPQINGFELAEQARLLAPRLPLILLSGNLPLLKKTDKDRLTLFTSTLKKPFTPADLAQTVSQAIQIRQTTPETPQSLPPSA
jgi:CheY-like chemotaxis protein